ncbi:hypothetical protein ACLBWX_18370 [Methylobacterium sp. M6A4_1b]
MSFRQIIAAVIATMAAIAQAIVSTARLVWEGGKWILKSMSPPAQQAPAAGASAADAISALAEVTETQAPAPAALPAPEPVDPVLEWGALAQRYAISQSVITGEDEPRLDGILDEPAIAWLQSLPVVDLLKLTNATPEQIGRHMLGGRPIPGLALCPTMQEWEQSKRQTASITSDMRERLAEGRQAMQDALDDLVNHPNWEPLRGV